MNSFSNEKMKELVTLLQLLVTAMVGIDEKTGELNEKQLYGMLQEQVKALNDNIQNLNTTLEKVETLFSSIVGNAYDVGYVRTMNASTNW